MSRAWRRRILAVGTAIMFLLGLGAGTFGSPLVSHVAPAHAASCNSPVGEYYETAQLTVSQNNTYVVNSQLHYRINTDCTFKAYNDGIWLNSQSCGNCYPYIRSIDMYDGTNTIFDSTGAYVCAQIGSWLGTFGALPRSLGPVHAHQYYYDNNCSTGTAANHYPNHQPN